MNKKTQTWLIIGGIVAVAGTGFVLWLRAKSKAKKEKEQLETIIQQNQELSEQEKQELTETLQQQTQQQIEETKEEVLQDIGEKTVGNYAYAKGDVAVRNDNEITDTWLYSNKLFTAKNGSKIGMIEKVMASDDTSDLKKWYQVKLPKAVKNTDPFGLLPLTTTGYVREDKVTIKQT